MNVSIQLKRQKRDHSQRIQARAVSFLEGIGGNGRCEEGARKLSAKLIDKVCMEILRGSGDMQNGLARDIRPEATEATPDKVRLASDQQPPVQVVIVPRLQRQAGERTETWFAPGSILTRTDQPFRKSWIEQRAAKMAR